ncbi:MAG: hypothetical protein IPM66_21615 [Acidobacteriota bacterium]|nr:MAG: hypothetical protein IPM66_21615 [Acidobacteriota bacterium]
MSEKLEEAQIALDQATGNLSALKAEQSAGAEMINGRNVADIDELTRLAERQKSLPELIFKATIETKKANLAVLEIKREIARSDIHQAVAALQAKKPAIQKAIQETEERLRELKQDLSILISTRNAAQAEESVLSARLVDADRELRRFIQEYALNDAGGDKAGSSSWRSGMEKLGGFGRLA